MKIKQGYTFDDVLLIPKHSEIQSRSNVDLSVDLGKGVRLNNPIISSNMKHVTGPDMAAKLASMGAMGVLHRFHSYTQDHILSYKKALQNTYNIWDNTKHANVAFSIGVQKQDVEIVNQLMDCDIPKEQKRICVVDVAHGDSSMCLKMVEYIAKTYSDALLIAGNVATPDGAQRLYDVGADVIKLNVGNGSLCTTRLETGNGVPTLTAISDVHNWKVENKIDVKLICDGGIRLAGDIVKACCFTDTVMLGNLLAGTDEAPGDVILKDGQKWKQYAGSSTHKTKHIEGVSSIVPYKGPVDNIINGLLEGIRSGLSYQGVDNLTDLKKDPQFVSVSHAGLIESKPHDVLVV